MRLRGARTFQRQVATAGAELEAMGVKGARAMTAFGKRASALRSFGSTMTRNLTLPAIALGAVAGKTAIDFDKSMAQVGVALKSPTEAMGDLRGLATKMGAETIFSANDAAQAMLDLAKGGMTQAQIQGGALDSTMQLAAAGGIELADAARQTASAMNTFGLGASDAQEIADSLAGAANASSADMGDLALSLQQVGQMAVATGLNIHETSGALAAFADNGIRGSDAGTSLKTFLQRLNPQSAKAKSMMRELGLEFFDAAGNAKSLTEIADQLRGGFKGLTQEQRLSAMQTLFGSDATRAANIIWKEGSGGLREYIKATKENGAAQKMANAQMQGLPGAWERLKGSLETAALALGEAMTPTLEALAGALEKVANWFTNLDPQVQKVAAGFVFAAIVIGPLTSALGFVASGVGKLVMFLPRLIMFTQGFLALRQGVGVMAALDIALKGFGLTLRGVMITTGIGAVIAAVVLLNEKFHFLGPTVEWVKKALTNAFDWIKTAVGNVVGWVEDHWLLFNLMTAGIPAIIKFFSTHLSEIGDVFSKAFDIVKRAVEIALWPLLRMKDTVEWLLSKVPELNNKAGQALGQTADTFGTFAAGQQAGLAQNPTPGGGQTTTGQPGSGQKVAPLPRRAGQGPAQRAIHHTTQILLEGKVLAEETVRNLESAAARA